MPYITEEDRKTVGKIDVVPLTSGELNYVITKLIHQYLIHKGLSWNTICEIIGALTGALQEFYRRVASKYEDTKVIQNGDVYHDNIRNYLADDDK